MQKTWFELLFYRTKVSALEWTAFFKKILAKKTILIDLSTALPLRSVRIHIRKERNHLKFFINEDSDIKALNNVIFPMRMENLKKEFDPDELNARAGPHIPFVLTSKYRLLNFLTEEGLVEIRMRLMPVLGSFIGIGHAVGPDLKKKYFLMTDPSSFLEFDFSQRPGFYLQDIKPVPKSTSVRSESPILENENTQIGTENFEVFKHGLIVGSSGTGKSKFSYMFMKSVLQKSPGTRIVIIDPHDEFRKLLASEKGMKIAFVDFRKTFLEPLAVGQEKSPQATQLLVELLFSVMSERNKYAERVLFYSIYLLSTIDKLNFLNLTSLLTDSVKRMEFLMETDNDEIRRFFSTEYNEIYTKNFSDGVLPVLNFIGEYEIYMGRHERNESLLQLIDRNRIVVISFDPNFMGRKMIKFIGGSVIQQAYMLAVTEKFRKPVILLADEFSLVSNKTAINILSEARKFNLFFYISLQYMAQLEKEVLDGIITNCYNVFAFKVNREDAGLLSRMMDIKLDDVFISGMSKSDIEEMKKDMFIKLEDREVIARLYNGKDFVPPVKVKTVDVIEWM